MAREVSQKGEKFSNSRTLTFMLKEKIKADSIVALKNHDSTKVGILRYLISLIDKKALQMPPEGMTETEEINVLRKELKNKEESKDIFAKANREDLVKEVEVEIEVLKGYLPSAMTEEELQKIVSEAVESNSINGKADFGAVMKEVMGKVAGRAGGEAVSRIVKEEIDKI